jgi:hypothetical protein
MFFLAFRLCSNVCLMVSRRTSPCHRLKSDLFGCWSTQREPALLFHHLPRLKHAEHFRLPESGIAPFLTSLQARVKGEDIRVGSYPKWGGGVHVSIIGHNHPRVKELAKEVESELQGKAVDNAAEEGTGTKL